MENHKPKLDSARRLRGLYVVDPDDENTGKPFKHARRKLERLMDAAMRCKMEIHSGTRKLVAELNASHKDPQTTKSWKVVHKARSGTLST